MTNIKPKLLCFVDKQDIPNHSFIDDFLAKKLSNNFDVHIFTSRGNILINQKYFQSRLQNNLFKRRGIGRFFNVILTIYIIFKNYNFNSEKHDIVFCRNDPSFLLGAVIAKFFLGFKLVYQSSFPHENTGGLIKGIIAKFIFIICSPFVNGVTAVSNEGMKRIKKYFHNKSNIVIPLLTNTSSLSLQNDESQTKFIYTGTLSPKRKLHIILNAFCISDEIVNKKYVLDIYGGTSTEWRSIVKKSILQTKKEFNNLIITHHENKPRGDVLNTLKNYDVGLSLLPTNDVTFEMSPTKLTEYLSNGLMVLATDNIPYQRELLNQSDAGIFVEFNEEDIAKGIQKITTNNMDRQIKKKNAYNYAKDKLLYDSKVVDFIDFTESL